MKEGTRIRTILSGTGIIVGLLSICGFLYFDRFDHISHFIYSSGIVGIFGTIFLMGFLCMTPLPSEGLLILDLKVYGVTWGLAFAWSGFILGTIATFWITRSFGIGFVRTWVPKTTFHAIDTWITRSGTAGILAARLLPVPAFIVNVITAMFSSVSFWVYLWTGVVAIIPYYTGATLIFHGLVHRDVYACLLGAPVLLIVWFIGRWSHNKVARDKE